MITVWWKFEAIASRNGSSWNVHGREIVWLQNCHQNFPLIMAWITFWAFAHFDRQNDGTISPMRYDDGLASQIYIFLHPKKFFWKDFWNEVANVVSFPKLFFFLVWKIIEMPQTLTNDKVCWKKWLHLDNKTLKYFKLN